MRKFHKSVAIALSAMALFSMVQPSLVQAAAPPNIAPQSNAPQSVEMKNSGQGVVMGRPPASMQVRMDSKLLRERVVELPPFNDRIPHSAIVQGKAGTWTPFVLGRLSRRPTDFNFQPDVTDEPMVSLSTIRIPTDH